MAMTLDQDAQQPEAAPRRRVEVLVHRILIHRASSARQRKDDSAGAAATGLWQCDRFSAQVSGPI
jgi:hypothetical protein